MKKIYKSSLLLTLLFVGCATQRTFMTSSQQSKDQVFDALQAMVAQKNYNVLDANKGAGFIRAEKGTLAPALRVLSGMENYDQLQITVFQQGKTVGVRVQALSFSEKTNTLGQKVRDASAPSEEVVRDAREILQQFGGEITEVK